MATISWVSGKIQCIFGDYNALELDLSIPINDLQIYCTLHLASFSQCNNLRSNEVVKIRKIDNFTHLSNGIILRVLKTLNVFHSKTTTLRKFENYDFFFCHVKEISAEKF